MNQIMNANHENSTMWDSFGDRVDLEQDDVLFTGTFGEVEYRMQKPYREFDEDDDGRTYADFETVCQIVSPENINTVDLACDAGFIEHLNDRFREFGVTEVDGIDRGDILAQGNNYVALEISGAVLDQLAAAGHIE